MGRVYDGIDDRLSDWLQAQHLFFVATAPLDAEGHVNVSPKGLDTFAVLGPLEVAYLDLTGSGIETVAHLRENGRICLMFCAFSGPPRIVRLHGRGEAVLTDDARFAELAGRFGEFPSARAVVRVDVQRISDSCGYAVPLMEFQGDRDQLHKWAANKGPDGIAEYQATRNAESLDGLPGLAPGIPAQR